MRCLVLLLVLLAACGPRTAGGVAVPAPVTTDMQPAVQRFLESERESVFTASGSAGAWGRYGMALHAHELLDDALVCYRAAAGLAPTNGRWPYLEGVVLERSGAPAAEVLARYDAAAKVDARYPPLHFRRGEILAQEGRLQEACEAFGRAIELDPRLAAAHRGRGQAFLGLDRVTDALADLEEAERLSPGDPAVAAALSQAFGRLGDRERAAQAAERSRAATGQIVLPDPHLFAVEGLSRSAEACLERGLAALAAGKPEQARENLAITVEARPDDGRAREALGRALMALGEPQAAYDELARATQILGTGVDRHRLMARCQLALGKANFAGLLLERALELDPADAALLGERALCYAQDEQFEQADATFAEARRLGELPPELLITWGDVARTFERFDEAREHYLEADRQKPGNADVLYGLGLAEEGMGLIGSAKERYRAVLMRQSSHPAGERLAALEDAGK